jgi:hypothetical protein
VRELLDRADGFYASGRLGFSAIPTRGRVAIAIAARLYQGIGHRLRRQGADPRRGRVVVPAWEKGWLLMRGAVDLLSARRSLRDRCIFPADGAAVTSAPMDPRHLELAIEFCEMVGADDLLSFLELTPAASAADAQAALKKKRSFYQSMQANPKHRTRRSSSSNTTARSTR